MPIYEYQGIDQKNQKRKGFIEATSYQEAKSKLRDQSLILLNLSEKKKNSSKKINEESLFLLTTQLKELISAGIPLYESLVAVDEYFQGDPLHEVLAGITEKVKNGTSLSLAMKDYPYVFDKLYLAMIKAGESSGSLPLVLERLKSLLQKRTKLKKQIQTALIYPSILALFALSVIFLLLGFVVPSIEGIFEDRNLNGYTRFVLGVSKIFRNYYWVYVPIFIATPLLIWREIKTPRGKRFFERLLLKMPLIKKVTLEAAIARFCRTLGTLLEGGVSLVDALSISKDVLQNSYLEDEIVKASQKIIEGSVLSQEISKSAYFPKLVYRMIAVGEDSGSTPAMLQKIADLYEEDLDKTIERALALMQPLILILMGGVIAVVMIGILLPLTDFSNLAL